MEKSNSLDPIKLPSQQILLFFLYVDSDTLDYKYYMNAILDIPNSRIAGYPLRYASPNEFFWSLIKDDMVKKIHLPFAKLFNSITDVNILGNFMGYKVLFERMFKLANLEMPSFEKILPFLEIKTYSVETTNLCCYIYFSPLELRTSSIIICPNCKTEYDLMNDSQIITDEISDQIHMADGRQIIKMHNKRNPDLLIKTPKCNSKTRNVVIERVRLLRNDPTIRWSCAKCYNEAIGYPGSFIMHDFKQ